MLKENCRDSGSTSYFNASNNKYKTSSPSSGRSKNNNNNGSINDINVNQFQELNNYRMTNWKSLVRLRENTRSPNSKYWKSCFGSPWIKYSLIFTVLYNYILFYIWYIWYYNDYFYIYRYFNGPYHLLCQLSIYNEYLPKK